MPPLRRVARRPEFARRVRQGKRVVVSRTTALPWRCVKSNEPTELSLNRELSWHTPIAYLGIFLGVLPYVIVAIMVRKTHKLRVPLSADSMRRRRRAIALGWLLILAGLAGIFGGIAVGSSEHGALGPLLLVGGLAGTLAGIILAIAVASPVTATRIDDDYVWLKGFHPAYVAELPEFPGKL